MIDYTPWRNVMLPDAIIVMKSAGRDGGMSVGLVDKVGRKTVGIKLLSPWDIKDTHVDISVATDKGLYSIPAEVRKVTTVEGGGYVTVIPLSQAAKIDKRKAERYSVALPVLFKPVSGDRFYEGIMDDISWAGCRMVWLNPEDIHLNKIILRLKIGEKVEDILGKVVWRKRGEEKDILGVEFLEHTSKLFRVFSDIVESGNH